MCWIYAVPGEEDDPELAVAMFSMVKRRSAVGSENMLDTYWYRD